MGTEKRNQNNQDRTELYRESIHAFGAGRRQWQIAEWKAIKQKPNKSKIAIKNDS